MTLSRPVRRRAGAGGAALLILLVVPVVLILLILPILPITMAMQHIADTRRYDDQLLGWAESPVHARTAKRQ